MKRRAPGQFDKVELTRDQCAALDRVATDIFMDRVMAGDTMGEALACVYLSGLQHGGSIAGKWETAA